MNENLFQDIYVEQLANVVTSMAKGKALRHEGIPMEFFQHLWQTVGHDIHQMILRVIHSREFHVGVTKGTISLIPNERDKKDLNYWRPITLLTTTYRIFAKILQPRFHPMLSTQSKPHFFLFGLF